ncbi:MAG: ABC transporter permease [Ferruginibacter sp.]
MKYFLQKIGYALLVVFGVVSIVFFLFRGFGDPARLVTGQTGDARTLMNIRHELYLDKPVWKQYLLYLNDLSPVGVYPIEELKQRRIPSWHTGGTMVLAIKWPYLGRSYQTKKDVFQVLMQALPGTIVLACTALLIASILGIGLGILSALKKGTWIDQTTIIGTIAGISAPSFYMAIIIGYLFGMLWHHQTGLNLTGSLFDINSHTGERYLALKNLWLPAITLGIRPMAIITQLTRSSMLDVLSQDFIRTARAKGLPVRQLVWRHALPNAMNPVVTAMTSWLAELLAGAFFVEYIFGWNGMGRVTVHALEKLDYPVVMGALLFSAAIFVLINFLSDMLYRWLDPRISG